MSEASPKPLPPDFPAIETPRDRINIRKALAGLHILKGSGSTMRCLMLAGYSRATARNLTEKGLGAQACIEEAAKFDPMMAPTKLLEAGRRRMAEALAVIDPTTTPLRDIARAFETTEKFFGGHEIQAASSLTTVADRLQSIVAMLVVARERGLPVPSMEGFVDVEIVPPDATGIEKSAADQLGLITCIPTTPAKQDTCEATKGLRSYGNCEP